jgi:hypothetical protein
MPFGDPGQNPDAAYYSFQQGEVNKITTSPDEGPRSWVCARETLRSGPHQH